MAPTSSTLPQDRLIRVSGLIFSGPVGKRLERRADGSIAKTPLLGERAKPAEVINVGFATADEAFEHRCRADARTMFFAGTFSPEVTGVAVPRAVMEGRERRGEAIDWETLICPTKDHLAFRPEPGLLPIDVDSKRADEVAALWPAEAWQLADTDAVYEAIDMVLPEANGCPTLIVPSSGSMIVDAKRGDFLKAPGGWRVLIAVDDATAIPRILEVIHLRCWARGVYRYAFVNDVGSFFPRSLADQALGRPTQPDYVVADLGPGLARAKLAGSRSEPDGPWLRAEAVVLSDADRNAAGRNIEQARRALEQVAVRLRQAAIRRDAEALVKRGVARGVAQRVAEKKFEGGVLLGSSQIVLDDGEVIRAAVLLTAEGENYDGRSCRDPVEPDYDDGRAVGKLFWDEGLTPGLFSFAHGAKSWRIAHDFETATAAMEAANGDNEAVVRAVALADVEPLERNGLEKQAAVLLGLGRERKVLREQIEAEKRRIAARRRRLPRPEPRRPEAPTGIDLDVVLPRNTFPHIELTDKGIKVLDHAGNIAHMLGCYGISYRYNVITKAIDWQHPDMQQTSDNAETMLLSQMLGLCALNDVPDKHLTTHLNAFAGLREYNPVTDYLSALEWDGKARFEALSEAMQAADSRIARIVMRLFLLEACAAADNAVLARQKHPEYLATFEGCPVPVGGQGVRKTKGLRELLPPALRGFFKEGLTLKLGDKDSVTAVVSCWIVELGELDATFQKSAISELKSFISRDVDEIRAPYAQKRSLFKRRTVITGTVNDEGFLADETGNRRFWPLTVGDLEVHWSEAELDQLWAEAWLRYAAGEQWWPTPEEEKLLAVNAERYRARSGLEESIEAHYQWGRRPTGRAKRQTATEIYIAVSKAVDGVGLSPLTLAASKTIGTTLARLWRNSGLTVTQRGVLMIVNEDGEQVRINATDGKNRGWLLPPLKTAAERVSGFGVIDGGLSDEEG